ncbi:MAG: cellobiose phosphorylase [Candidatus Omnitrophota bacterium]
MLYKFIDNKGTFTVKNPHKYNAYFPLTNRDGAILSSISPNLGGDIKQDNSHFLTPPASIEDVRNNLLCRRDFFIKIDKKVFQASLPANDTLEAGFFYHKLTKKTALIDVEITNFIPYDLSVEVMWVKVTNKTTNPIKITPTSFIPLYGRGEKEIRDHRHVSSLLNRVWMTKYGIFLKPTMVFNEKGHKINDTTYFALGFQDNNISAAGQFPTLDSFCGESDLITPDAIHKNIKPATKKTSSFDGKECCAAFRFKDKQLKGGQSVNYFVILGMTTKEKSITNILNKLNSLDKVQKSLQATQKYWLSHFSKLEFDFKDSNFTNWLRWVKAQPTLRKLFGCSFLPHFDYGKGGRGWRDLWQDALTLLLTEPDKAKTLISGSFKGIRIDGSNATIITKEGGFLSDRNSISRVWCDHGVWPYLTLESYINRTGEISFLLKELPYFNDHLSNRAKKVNINFHQKDYILRTAAGKIYSGSVLEHILIQTLTSFFNVGKHNVIRLEGADWNDGLDMAPEEGESAAFSFMYARNLNALGAMLKILKGKTSSVSLLKELTFLLDKITNPINYDNYKEKQTRLEKYFSKIEKFSGEKTTIQIDDLIDDLQKKGAHLSKWLKDNEWLDTKFFNGYYDNKGLKAEGIKNKKARMMMPSQVFAIMSENLDQNQIKQTWISIKKYLYDPALSGFRLNTDFKTLYPDLGRAFGFSYGDKENGAFFNHMIIMLGFSLYKEGFIDEGNQVINSIYKMAVSKKASIYPILPEYFNNEGRGLYTYLTGSGSWYIHTLTNQILGIQFTMGDLIINPKLLASNFIKDKITISLSINDKKIKVSFKKNPSRHNQLKAKTALLEKEKITFTNSQCIIKKEKLANLKKKEIEITVYLG